MGRTSVPHPKDGNLTVPQTGFTDSSGWATTSLWRLLVVVVLGTPDHNPDSEHNQINENVCYMFWRKKKKKTDMFR